MAQTKSALLLIDLQNEFLSPTGLLGKNHALVSSPDLLKNIHKLVEAYVQTGNENIIWIQSDYSISTLDADAESSFPPIPRPQGEKYANVPINSAFLQSSHTQQRHNEEEPCTAGKLCCKPGTQAFEIHDDLKQTAQLAKKSQFIVKRWYSAFKGTKLADILRGELGLGLGLEKGSTLYIAGLTANNCVMATVVDAFFLEYNVVVVEDCLGATSDRLKKAAVEKMAKSYADIVTLKTLPFAHQVDDSAKPQVSDDEQEMVLYWVNGSIPSWRVMLFLSHQNIKYTAKRLKVMSTPKETRSDTFRAINPRCKTPTLVDADGTVVIESLAILQYLESYHTSKDPSLVPSKDDKPTYSKVIQRFQESENLHNVCETMELCFLDDYRKHKDMIIDSLDGTMEELKFWEKYLEETTYIASNQFSLADCAFYPILGYLVHRGLKLDGDEFPNLLRYHDAVTALEFAKPARPGGWEKLSRVNLFARSRELKDEEEEDNTTATPT